MLKTALETSVVRRLRMPVVRRVKIKVANDTDYVDYVKAVAKPPVPMELVEKTCEKIREGRYILVTAKVGNRIIGGTRIGAMWRKFGIEENLSGGTWVHALFRGIGIGERMLREALREADNRFKGPLWAYIDHDNEHSLKLHEKVGFKVVDRPGMARIIEKTRLDRKGETKRQVIVRFNLK